VQTAQVAVDLFPECLFQSELQASRAKDLSDGSRLLGLLCFAASTAGIASMRTCSTQAGVRHFNPRREDGGAVMYSSFGFVKRGRCTDEESLAVVATQHTGKCAEVVGLEVVEDRAAFGDTDYAPVENVGDPNRSLRVQANAVGYNVRLLKNLANIRCCGRFAEGRPGAAFAQCALNSPWLKS
jgi:hypothetical protein